jgi:hypothetical protein
MALAIAAGYFSFQFRMGPVAISLDTPIAWTYNPPKKFGARSRFNIAANCRDFWLHLR